MVSLILGESKQCTAMCLHQMWQAIVADPKRRDLCGDLHTLAEFLAQEVTKTGRDAWLRCSSMTCNHYRKTPFANGCTVKHQHGCKYLLVTTRLRLLGWSAYI